ncbi:MAG: hypothetical protein SFV19_09260 [Rhodospirillaceae bacterium]|nr:hypothetical protein [Rhodospirillaceae bacterium]
MSSTRAIPERSISVAVNAVTASGISCNDSARLRAVTMISSIWALADSMPIAVADTKLR